MQGITCLAEELSESQGFCSVDLFTYLFNEEGNTQLNELAAETFIS